MSNYSQRFKYPNLDDTIPGCVHFRWREALWLPKWDVFVYPTELQAQNIIRHAKVMDSVRNIIGKPFDVHCWLRPQNYNDWAPPYGVSGAHLSSHVEGLAVDFHAVTMATGDGCDQVRATLLSQLSRLNIRMEDRPGSDWVHIDSRTPGGAGRFFKP